MKTLLSCAGGLLLAAAVACSDVNVRTASYSTLAEARQAGAIEKGWLPDGLPPGTRDIRIAYLPDSSGGPWGLFNFPENEGAGVKRMLQPDAIPLEGRRLEVPGRIEWWPVALRGDLNGERLGLTGLKAYSTADDARIMAVNWSQGRAYYWPAR